MTCHLKGCVWRSASPSLSEHWQAKPLQSPTQQCNGTGYIASCKAKVATGGLYRVRWACPPNCNALRHFYIGKHQSSTHCTTAHAVRDYAKSLTVCSATLIFREGRTIRSEPQLQRWSYWTIPAFCSSLMGFTTEIWGSYIKPLALRIHCLNINWT